jgi:hypothetical protein
VYLATAHGAATISAVAGRVWDPGFTGRFDLLSGRAPHGADEILASPSALTRLGAHVGGAVTSADGEHRYTVVGTMRDETIRTDQPVVFGGLTAFPQAVPQHPAHHPQELSQFFYYLAGPPLTRADLPVFNRHGATVLSKALSARHAELDLFSDVPFTESPGGWGASPLVSVVWSYGAVIGIGGAFVLFEVVLLAGAGFLVGARQQQRALAVLASVGADRRLLARSVSLGGTVVGVAGAVLGLVLGLAGAAVAMALLRDGSSSQFYGFGASPPVLAVIALVAVLASWVAAAVPARGVSRFDVVAALRGARRPPRPSRLAPALGGFVMIVGVGVAVLGGVITLIVNGQDPRPENLMWIGPTLIVVGSIVLQLGAILGVPLLLRLAARLAGGTAAARIATRDLARNSARAVPAIAAVMSTVFVAAFVMAAAGGGEKQAAIGYEYRAPMNTATLQLPPGTGRSDATAALDLMRTALRAPHARLIHGAPDAALRYGADGQPILTGPPRAEPRLAASAHCVYVETSAPTCHAPQFLSSTGYGAHIVVGDAADLATVLGRAPSAAAARALADGGAVALYRQYALRGHVTIDWWTAKQLSAGDDVRAGSAPERSASLPAVVDLPPHAGGYGVVVSPTTAARLGLEVQPLLVLAPFRTAPTADQQDRINGYLAAHATGPNGEQQGFLTIEQGPAHFAGGMAWIVLAVAGLLTLAASVIALGLARVDGRRDELTLGAVGAPPRSLRGIAFWQALVLAGLGSLIGGVFALVPAYAMSIAGTMAFAPPWLQLAAAVVAVPLGIAAVTALTRRTPRWAIVDRAAIG